MRTLFILLVSFFLVSGVEESRFLKPAATDGEIFENHIRTLFSAINFGSEGPAYDLFQRGVTGYYNLKASGRFSGNQVLTLIDFRLSSNTKRLWTIDLRNRRLLFYSLVAHGRGSGQEYARTFSNTPHSNQSSLGFYQTGSTYIGKHGLSLRLEGLEEGFNDNAASRALVIHGAEYVSRDFIRAYGRLGRSLGCPALPIGNYSEVIKRIANNTCLFIFADDASYIKGTRLYDPEKAARYFAKRVNVSTIQEAPTVVP